ncbi:MAG: PAS domain S-box protein [Chloroflexota bacterium]
MYRKSRGSQPPQDGQSLELNNLPIATGMSRQIIEASPSGMILVDARQPDLPIVYVNTAFTKLTGYTLGEVVGRNCRFLQGDDHDQPGLMTLKAALKERVDCTVTLRNYRKDGRLFWNELRISPIYDPLGHVTHFIGVQNDITDRKAAEAALIESTYRFKMTLEGTRAGIWEWNIQTGETHFNARWAAIIGCTLDELAPISIQTWIDHTHPDDLQHSTRLLQRHFAGEIDTYECEVRMKHKDGHWVWVQDRGRVMEWDDDGQPLRMFGTHIDITQRKRMEEALRASEERFRAFVQQSNDGIVLVDKDARIIEWNPAQERITGVKRDHALGRPLLTVQSWSSPSDEPVTEAQKTALDTAIRQALAGEPAPWLGKPLETRIVHQDGSKHTVESIVFPIETSQGRILGSILRDITEHMEIQQALRESQERYRSVIQAMNEGVVLQHRDGTIQACNPAAERILGLTAEQMTGRTSVDPRWAAIREDGSPFPGEDHPAMITLRSGRAQTDVIMGVHKPDSTLTWISVNSQPIFYDVHELDTLPDAVVTTFIDITQQRQAKAREFELALERERTHLLTDFIQYAAHEFKTPLATISLSAHLLARATDPDNRSARAAKIEDQVKQTTDLVDMLLTVARLEGDGIGARAMIDINTIMCSACETVLNRRTTENLTVSCEPHPGLPLINASASYLEQAVRHLLDNACLYTPPGGEIRVASGMTADHVWLEVRDTGPGIPQEDQKNIFQTFWRRDRAHSTPGLGLGLTIAQKIAHLHNGQITVNSVVGVGSVFRIALPYR